jgi:hypothetical protein
MIKSKNPPRADISQMARLTVERATGVPLTPLKTSHSDKLNNQRKKHPQKTEKTNH